MDRALMLGDKHPASLVVVISGCWAAVLHTAKLKSCCSFVADVPVPAHCTHRSPLTLSQWRKAFRSNGTIPTAEFVSMMALVAEKVGSVKRHGLKPSILFPVSASRVES